MKRIAVLVSGGGTILQALIDAQGAGAIQNGTIAAAGDEYGDPLHTSTTPSSPLTTEPMM